MESPISVVINTLNEENNLPYAIRSVKPWVDEIIVVDMYSDDRTVEIARELGAKVFFHKKLGFVEPARKFALEQATNDWVLILDADELIPAPLSRKLKQISGDDVADVVSIHRLNYLLGSPMMYTGWGPSQDSQARFFKRGFLEVSDIIHSPLKPVLSARIMELVYQSGYSIVHFNYLDIADFIERLNRYTSIEAKQIFECRKKNSSFLFAACKGLKGFLQRYIRQGGYRDGWRGAYLSALWVFYRLATYAKLRELEMEGTRREIELKYQSEAEQILNGYEN